MIRRCSIITASILMITVIGILASCMISVEIEGDYVAPDKVQMTLVMEMNGETSPAIEVIAIWDINGRILYNNRSVEDVLGYTPSEIKGLSAPDLFHPEDLPALLTAIERGLPSPSTTHRMEARVLHRAGWPENIRIYNARHSVGIGFSEGGEDLADIQAWMGHRRIQTTRKSAEDRGTMAKRLGTAVGGVLRNVLQNCDLRRVAVAGGDTSGWVARTLGIVIGVTPIFIMRDVAIVQPHFTSLNTRETPREISLSRPEALHFRALQDQPRLDRFQDLEIPAGTLVCGYRAIRHNYHQGLTCLETEYEIETSALTQNTNRQNRQERSSR